MKGGGMNYDGFLHYESLHRPDGDQVPVDATRSLKMVVRGTPVPQGSKRAFVNKRTSKAVVVESAGARHRTYRGDIREEAESRWPWDPTDQPMVIRIVFRFRRPQSHFRTGKNAHLLRDSAPFRHTQRPDADKLLRSVLDALTGVVFVDDSQVISVAVGKEWGTVDETVIDGMLAR